MFIAWCESIARGCMQDGGEAYTAKGEAEHPAWFSGGRTSDMDPLDEDEIVGTATTLMVIKPLSIKHSTNVLGCIHQEASLTLCAWLHTPV